MPEFNWNAFDATVAGALVTALNGRHGYLVALSGLYAERDRMICAPLLYVNTDGKHFESPADWPGEGVGWLPERAMDALTEHACSATVAHWDATFARFLDSLVRACVTAATQSGLPVCYLDDDEEVLLGRMLTPEQIAHFFPYLAATRAEHDRALRLDADERLAYFVSELGKYGGPLDPREAEQGLADAGSAAIPLLLPLLRRPDGAWLAAKLLADIGIPDPAALDALSGALPDLPPDGSDQLWVCSALARLGALDVVLRHPSTSAEARAGAIVANFTAFRDEGRQRLELSYQPLEDGLDRPELAEIIAARLRPGTPYCAITPDEIPTALKGTSSRHSVVRKHAVCVLGNRELEDPRINACLRTVRTEDPDPEVRGLAGLSLTCRKADHAS